MTSFHQKVLDFGYVEYVAHLGNDNSSLVAARLSTDNPTGVSETKDDNLRTRLWRDQHTSPFESAELVVNIQLPVFCLRQLDRHRTLDYADVTTESLDQTFRKFINRNEFSGRYSEMPDLFYIPTPDRILGKDPNNKQSSLGPLPKEVQELVVDRIKKSTVFASDTYKWMIEWGVANEIARFVLPGNQYTKIQLKGDLLSWFKMLNLRLREDVQLETRLFCVAIGNLVMELFPKSWEVFQEHTYHAITFSKTEMDLLKRVLSDNPVALVELLRSWDSNVTLTDKQITALANKLEIK